MIAAFGQRLFSRLTSATPAAALGALALFGLAACVQEPSSEPPVDNTSTATQQLVSEAQEHYRQSRYEQALTAYEQALALDSSLSQAYFGHAKATVAVFGLDKASILEDMQATAEDPSRFAFLDHPDSVLTMRLQVSSRVRRMLGKLTDRDTLTRWYAYLEETTPWSEGVADTLYQQRREFMTDYLIKADLGVPGYRKASAFPLSDLKVSAASVADDYVIFQMVYTITRLYDLDQNDTIDARDSIMKSLAFSSGGGFQIDSLSAIGAELEGDSAAQANLNALIAAMSSGLVNSSQLAELIGGGSGSPIPDTTASAGSGADSVLASMGSTISFYQFGDGLDNDGDGCVDEEILDDKDNDLDGFIDEDARVIPADRPDNIDNDRDGFRDPINPPLPLLAGTDSAGREALVGATVYPAKPHVLGFVHAYLTAQGELDLPEFQTTWVRVKKGAPAELMALRLAIQNDSLAVRIPVGGPVPDSLVAKLAHARSVVGGCWRIYP